jgi:DNA topoisomerase-1
MRLRRVDPQDPGVRRVRHGNGFRYVGPDGTAVNAETRARCKALVIPPAWTEVWICREPNGHLQAVGTDDAGRRQYLYHEEYRRRQDAQKHERVLTLARRLPRVRAAVVDDLRGRGLTRDRVVAVALRMLDHGVFRTGGEEYASENGSQGVATLNRDDVSIHGDELEFSYVAKGGSERTVSVPDRLLASAVLALKRSRPEGTSRLLTYRGPDDWREVHAEDVNARFKEIAGDEYTVKDLRTWHATVLAAVVLAGPAPQTKRERTRAVRAMLEEVSDELGNTPAVARASYVDPRIIELFSDGGGVQSRTLSRTRPADLLRAKTRESAERAVIRLLEQ